MFLISYSGFVHIVEKKIYKGTLWRAVAASLWPSLNAFPGGFSPANKQFGKTIIDF